MLTEKRARFCEEYLVDLNATQAAIRAGYAPRSAYSQSHDLLKKPEVRTRIAQLMMVRSERTRITGDRVVEELARIAFANIGTFLATDVEGYPRLALDRASIEDMGALAEFAWSPGPDTEAEVGDWQPEDGFRLKMHDKLKALDLLGRHLGMSGPWAAPGTGNPRFPDTFVCRHRLNPAGHFTTPKRPKFGTTPA